MALQPSIAAGLAAKVDRRPRLPRAIATTAVVASVVFAATIASLDATTRGYSPVRQVASDLSLTEHGAVMRLLLVAFGVAQAMFGLGVRRSFADMPAGRRVGILFVVFGAAFAVGGLVNVDAGATVRTIHGAVHDAAAAIGLTALAVSAGKARRLLARGGLAWIAATAAAAATVPLLAATQFIRSAGGAIQRVMLLIDLIYICALAIALRSSFPPGDDDLRSKPR